MARLYKGTTMRKLTLLLLPLLLAACGEDTAPTADASVVDTARPYTVHEWPLPAQEHFGQPELALAPDGRVLLTWISSIHGRRPPLMDVGMAEQCHWYSA